MNHQPISTRDHQPPPPMSSQPVLGIWTNSNTLGATSTNAPVTLRIVGTALMGNVNVAVNHRAKPAQVLSEQEVGALGGTCGDLWYVMAVLVRCW